MLIWMLMCLGVRGWCVWGLSGAFTVNGKKLQLYTLFCDDCEQRHCCINNYTSAETHELPGNIRSKVNPLTWAKRFCPLKFRLAKIKPWQTGRHRCVLCGILKFKNLNCHVFLKLPSRDAIVGSTFGLWQTDLGLAGGAGKYLTEMLISKIKQVWSAQMKILPSCGINKKPNLFYPLLPSFWQDLPELSLFAIENAKKTPKQNKN